jgi:hypothetical protein
LVVLLRHLFVYMSQFFPLTNFGLLSCEFIIWNLAVLYYGTVGVNGKRVLNKGLSEACRTPIVQPLESASRS